MVCAMRWIPRTGKRLDFMSLELKLIVYLIGAIASAIGAWELKNRIENRNRKLKEGLDAGCLDAVIVTDFDGKSIRQVATLCRIDNRYRLCIETEPRVSDDLNIKKVFETRRSLETFLEDKTRFRLGDFVRRQDSNGPDRPH